MTRTSLDASTVQEDIDSIVKWQKQGPPRFLLKKDRPRRCRLSDQLLNRSLGIRVGGIALQDFKKEVRCGFGFW